MKIINLMKQNWIAIKSINYLRIKDLLKDCEKTNQYTNGGINVTRLENFIRINFKIDNSKTIICMCNATVAIWALCNSIEMKVNKKLKWVTQSFTFPSSAQGLLQDTIILDIDEEGGLDLNEVEKIKDKIDGIIVTNIFGNVVNINKYEKWCNKNNKYLVFDNAATGYTFYQGKNSCNYGNGSIISFHHTKPFGFGEGGCVIIDREYEEETRRLINFGIHNEKNLSWSTLGGNYKMSEITAIYILQYLESNFFKIVKHHIEMYQKYINKYEMYPNFGDKDKTVLSCFCLLNKKYTKEYINDLIKKGVMCRKYYNPLIETKNSCLFYNKILCYPLNLNINYICI